MSHASQTINQTDSKENISMTTAPKEISYANDKESMSSVRETLARAAGSTFNVDQGVAYHTDPRYKISLPEGMGYGKGAKVLTDLEIASQQVEAYSHRFMFRPWDGAYAVTEVMRKYFGTQGRGMAQRSLFGTTPPQKISVNISATDQVEVPWGEVRFEPIEGSLHLESTMDPEYGMIFMITAQCPKKYMDVAKGFCLMVQEQLENFSIYKGKSIQGTEGEPRFITAQENPTIIYNEDVEYAMNTTVWGVLRNRNLMKSDNPPRKVNKRVLLSGPYGTGKSEAGMRTARVANENDTTFISFHSGKSSLQELEATIAMARLYAPSVVFIEDIDVYASNSDPSFQTRLSNLIDGLGSKGDEVMILMTSNHAADFSKAMLRAGRVDRLIEVGSLDRDATERLVRTVIGEGRLDDLDYERVHEAVEGFEPAFVRQTFDQAAEAALLRTGSHDYKLSTEDMVVAANLLRPQWELHHGAQEKKVTTFDSALRTVLSDEVRTVLGNTKLNLEDGDFILEKQLTD